MPERANQRRARRRGAQRATPPEGRATDSVVIAKGCYDAASDAASADEPEGRRSELRGVRGEGRAKFFFGEKEAATSADTPSKAQASDGRRASRARESEADTRAAGGPRSGGPTLRGGRRTRGRATDGHAAGRPRGRRRRDRRESGQDAREAAGASVTSAAQRARRERGSCVGFFENVHARRQRGTRNRKQTRGMRRSSNREGDGGRKDGRSLRM